MRTKLYFDNNAWDILFDSKINLTEELPADAYEILITREAEFEIPGMPDDKKKYTESMLKASNVKTDTYFGYYNPALSSSEQRVAGYGSVDDPEAGGRFADLAETEFLRAESIAISGTKKKTGLYGNEADVSLGARALIAIIVTGDGRKALKRAHTNWGGRMIDIKKYDNTTSFGDFIKSEISTLCNGG